MDQVSSILTSFPPAPGANISDRQLDVAIKEYTTALKDLGTTFEAAILENHSQFLQLLNPSENSIGYLAILDVLLASTTTDRSEVLDATLNFILSFEQRQVRYVGSLFTSLLESIGSGKLYPPMVATELLATAILRIDPSGSMFTSAHLSLANLSYETNCTGPALKVIERDLTSYPGMANSRESRPLCDIGLPPAAYISTSTGLTRAVKSSAVLEYNLVSGLIYMSRREWPKALKALERTVTHPSKDKGVSKIMLEANKKWLLVGLLCNGELPSLPPYTASSAKTTYSNLSGPYIKVGGLFSTPDAAQLKSEVESNHSVWSEDGNESLIAEVLSAYQKWQIINLRQVYSQIAISHIQSATSSAETGEPLNSKEDVISLIRSMIDSNMLKGELHASQGSEDSYLTFHDDRALLAEQDFAREIAQSHHAITTLKNDYQAVNDRLSGSREYVKYLVREQKRSDQEIEHPSGSFETQIEDEDLMTGIIAHG